VLDHQAERTIVLSAIDPLQDAPGDGDNVHVVFNQQSNGKGMLVMRSGAYAGDRYFLQEAISTIGRHPDSSVCLDDVTVSRRHAEVQQSNGQFRVIDLGSLNGTYINQSRIEESNLEHGDELQVGKYRMVFFDGSQS
jgi:pSer/pThr/pTyr-binding forkhead associated (FHA) protein